MTGILDGNIFTLLKNVKILKILIIVEATFDNTKIILIIHLTLRKISEKMIGMERVV